VRFGSLDVRLDAGHQRYLDVLPNALRVWPNVDDATEPDVELVARDGPERRPDVAERDDVLRLEGVGDRTRVLTAISELEVDATISPSRARLVVHTEGQPAQALDVYIALQVQKLLQLLGCLRLHGAAVVLGERTHVFLGDKGAGKSTLALAAGRAGGIVLADDQLVMRRRKGGIWLSGVDGGLRLTERTERHFFQEPLDEEPRDFAGTPKKEIALGDHVRARPGVDARPHTLSFLRVGDRLAVHEITRHDATRRMLDTLLPQHRFGGAEDLRDFLALVRAFVSSVDTFELSLSPSLSDLEQLVARLHSGHW
jgi:hypothetical protein